MFKLCSVCFKYCWIYYSEGRLILFGICCYLVCDFLFFFNYKGVSKNYKFSYLNIWYFWKFRFFYVLDKIDLFIRVYFFYFNENKDKVEWFDKKIKKLLVSELFLMRINIS